MLNDYTSTSFTSKSWEYARQEFPKVSDTELDPVNLYTGWAIQMLPMTRGFFLIAESIKVTNNLQI